MNEQAYEIGKEAAMLSLFEMGEFDTIEDRVLRVTSIAAFTLYEIEESLLREFFEMGGVDLLDYNDFSVASHIVTSFVHNDCLVVGKRLNNSLVDFDHPVFLQEQDSEYHINAMQKIRFDGIMFRSEFLEVVE